MRPSATNPELPHQTRPTLEPSPTRSDCEHEVMESLVQNFSIVVGGPVYDLLLRLGLMRHGLPNILRRMVAVIALTWVPLLLLSLRDGAAFGDQVQIPLLSDFSIYGRLVFGLPLLLLAEIVIDPAIRRGVAEFVDARFVRDQELPKFESILRKVQRLRDSWIPEILLFALAFFPVFVFQHEWTTGTIASWHTGARGLTAAGWWYAAFSAPLMRFVAYRWGFRYCVWAALLWRITRLHLVLMPDHPDRAAGLSFLGGVQKHFGILFCALGCSFAGRVANSIVWEGAPLGSFKSLIVGFIGLSLIVGVFPLALLAPKLAKVRKAGLREYGRLASSYTESFDRKWVHYDGPPSEPLLGAADIQSLADMGKSYGLIDAMRMAPISKKLIVQLAVQTAVPLIPVIILGTPTPELVHQVMKMML